MSTEAISAIREGIQNPEASALTAAVHETETMVVLAASLAAKVETSIGAGLLRVAEDGNTQGRGHPGTSVRRARKSEREASGS
jgi:hypothetical protein